MKKKFDRLFENSYSTYYMHLDRRKEQEGSWKHFKRTPLCKFARVILYTCQAGRCFTCERHIQVVDHNDSSAKALPYATIDHMIPRSRGGSCTSIYNMTLMCQACNAKKSDKIPSQRSLERHRDLINRIDLVLAEKKKPQDYSFPPL